MSSAAENPSNFPTMIIPRETEIRINDQGQLSIKTPGNLVIQNSGNYSELESTNGSIRIEENVNVDAVSVRAGQACFIQGTLTAWRVKASRIALEDRARAYIMLQEADHLELSKTSRLVGNFANEKEIYLLLGKFNQQLKQLPGAVGMDAADEEPRPRTKTLTIEPSGESAESSESAGLTEPLKHALELIDQELRRADLDSASAESLREIVFGLRQNNMPRVKLVYRDAFSQLAVPSERLKAAYDLLDRYFTNQS